MKAGEIWILRLTADVNYILVLALNDDGGFDFLDLAGDDAARRRWFNVPLLGRGYGEWERLA